MAEKLLVVAAERISDTGSSSGRFMRQAGILPKKKLAEEEFGPAGVLQLRPPNKEECAMFDQGKTPLVWEICFEKSVDFHCLVKGFDDGKKGNAVADLLAHQEVPNCTLLVPLELLPRVEQACHNRNISIRIHHHAGTLSTS